MASARCFLILVICCFCVSTCDADRNGRQHKLSGYRNPSLNANYQQKMKKEHHQPGTPLNAQHPKVATPAECANVDCGQHAACLATPGRGDARDYVCLCILGKPYLKEAGKSCVDNRKPAAGDRVSQAPIAVQRSPMELETGTTSPPPPPAPTGTVPATAVTVQQSDRPVASTDTMEDEMPSDEADDKAEKQQEQQQQNSTMKETLSLLANGLIVTCPFVALFVFVFRKMFSCCRHHQAAAAAEVYSVVNF